MDAGGTRDWLSAPPAAWSIGPSLLLELFDAGRRRARVYQARAVRDQAGAAYRGVVLSAFQEVEDSWPCFTTTGTPQASSAPRSLDFAMNRYREGARQLPGGGAAADHFPERPSPGATSKHANDGPAWP